MTERPVWQEFDPSTFTFIGRNDLAIKWAVDQRWEQRLPQPKAVWLLGSGVIEPFTVAAMPGLEKARIIAVDKNPELVSLGEDIKKGHKISWEYIANISQNPGRPNRDLTETERITSGLNRLKLVGSLANLGGFDLQGIEVPKDVSRRVTFTDNDALSFLQHGWGEEPDIIGDFFVQVNINKHKSGPKYSREMIAKSLEHLHYNGYLLIGDTGRNLAQTLMHFLTLENSGRLNLSSLVHAVNFGEGVTSSHYLLASKLCPFPGWNEFIDQTRYRLRNPKFADLDIKEYQWGLHGLWDAIDDGELNWAYVNSGVGTSSKPAYQWNSSFSGRAIKSVVPEKGDEFSERIIFPAQKPDLQRPE